MDDFLGSARSAGDSPSASPDTRDRIQKILDESTSVGDGKVPLPYDRKIDEAAGLDSIAVLEFVAAVEKEFGIVIETEFLELDFLRDLPALAAYIERRMAGRFEEQAGRPAVP